LTAADWWARRMEKQHPKTKKVNTISRVVLSILEFIEREKQINKNK
jgi:hypothetical protein